MRLSELFTNTRKQVPKDETAKNAQLLMRAGYIHKEMAGAYAFLPLGLRVIENIKSVVRQEMNEIGGQELLMTTLQRKELWASTDRWDDKQVDIWFKSQFKDGSQVGFGWSHEEPITDMMRSFINSYRDLPAYVYQFQTKLRNELRAKSGLLRGREFIMKDLYSYTVDEAKHQAFYNQVTKVYLKIFAKLGLGDRTYLTYASGEPFTQFSHEFQTLLDVGEDTIHLDRSQKLAVNQEVISDKVLKQLGLRQDKLETVKAAEVGNIFSFGTDKSRQLDLYFSDRKGKKTPVVLGSYGIGISRLMGVMVEAFADDKGIIWPAGVAPAKVQLVVMGQTKTAADKLYKQLTDRGIEVLYDDRDESPGVKLADADLMGIPQRVVISDKTLAKDSAELKARQSQETKLVKLESLTNYLEN